MLQCLYKRASEEGAIESKQGKSKRRKNSSPKAAQREARGKKSRKNASRKATEREARGKQQDDKKRGQKGRNNNQTKQKRAMIERDG